MRPTQALTRLPLLLALATLCGGCSPVSPSGKGDDIPPGQTTDTFEITVSRWAEGQGGIPIEAAVVTVDFIDIHHIDPQTNQPTVRKTARGVTDVQGAWSETVSYYGAGDFACDKVHYLVTHPDYDPHFEDLPIHDHRVTTHVELDTD